MKNPPKNVSKLNTWTYLILLLGLASCDFSADEYYEYSNNKDENHEIYLHWRNSAECAMTIFDTTVVYDAVQLHFPSDKSSFQNQCETYYMYISDRSDITIDSVKKCMEYFEIPENDARILSNDLVLLHFTAKNSLVHVDTLFRKKITRNFIEQLPLPKLH